MSLRELKLECEYRTDASRIIEEFYVPCLAQSNRYWRAVGYFTSQGLVAAARGLSVFVRGSGAMRLVASPFLDPEDVEAIEKGYAARLDLVERAILRQLARTPSTALEQHRLSCLAWLVAEERLEIMLALPKGRSHSALYHEKIGLFIDEADDTVAFTGSPNETIGGLISNFESIDVYCSWDDTHGRTLRKRANFERLWANQTPNLEVISFPEAAKQMLLRHRPTLPPEADPEMLHSLAGESPQQEWIGRRSTLHSVASLVELWPHQREAIAAWESNKRRGILAMATGSGKTLTALSAVEKCVDAKLVVIAVPRANLVEQWRDEMREHTALPEPILVFDSTARWQDRLFDSLRARRAEGWKRPVVVVGTLASLSGRAFESVLEDAGWPHPLLLVADEMHNAGAPVYRRVLRDEYDWRMGLSATPARHFDEPGTDLLLSYFDGVVYEYGLGQALADGFLSPYRYYVYAAELEMSEYTLYGELSDRIVRLRHSLESSISREGIAEWHGDSDEVQQLLFRRARILKKCTSKTAVVRTTLQEHPPKRTLIYCGDNEQLQDVSRILTQLQVLHTTYVAQTPSDVRRRALEALERGHVPAIVAIDCLDEGVDVPAVDTAIILASSTNRRQFIQRRGRVLRLAPGKKLATLVDLIAVPPIAAGEAGRSMLRGELSRVKDMAELAENRLEALLQVEAITGRYGVLMSELLSGVDHA